LQQDERSRQSQSDQGWPDGTSASGPQAYPTGQEQQTEESGQPPVVSQKSLEIRLEAVTVAPRAEDEHWLGEQSGVDRSRQEKHGKGEREGTVLLRG
jgi:hypothetical protein